MRTTFVGHGLTRMPRLRERESLLLVHYAKKPTLRQIRSTPGAACHGWCVDGRPAVLPRGQEGGSQHLGIGTPGTRELYESGES